MITLHPLKLQTGLCCMPVEYCSANRPTFITHCSNVYFVSGTLEINNRQQSELACVCHHSVIYNESRILSYLLTELPCTLLRPFCNRTEIQLKYLNQQNTGEDRMEKSTCSAVLSFHSAHSLSACTFKSGQLKLNVVVTLFDSSFSALKR